jgi:monoamine oxidase
MPAVTQGAPMAEFFGAPSRRFGRDETTSALSILREWAAIREEQRLPDRASWIKGGTDKLPFGLAARLGDRVVYGAEVKRLEQDERGVRAERRDAPH